MNTAQRYEQFFNAAQSSDFAYARARSWRASGHVEDNGDYVVRIYKRDGGYSNCIASLDGLDEAARILDAVGRPFPYSPIERA